MQYFPIFVDGQQLSVLIVGGGEVATRKAELILKCPAKVTVISPDITPSIKALADDNKLDYIKGYYDKSLLTGKQLVFVATENSTLNQQITEDAKAVNVLANVVDNPPLCRFITPSIVDRSPMVFAISSEGKSPVLVRYWRERLETLLSLNMGKIASFAGSKRQHIKHKLDSISKRRHFWEVFFSSSRAEDPQQITALYDQLIDEVDNEQPITGELYVVQTPATPDNLTLTALRHMQKADVAIYDKDISSQVLELVRRDAERELSRNDQPQQIQALLSQGLKVCYLASASGFKQSAEWSIQDAKYFKTVND